MDIVSLIISLLSGVAGGNVAGAAMKEKDLGGLGNTIAGLIGGGAGGYLLQALDILNKSGVTNAVGNAVGQASTGMDIGSILANIGASGVGGALLTVVVALIKSAMNKA